jgi:hypothetical protein
MGLLKVVAKSKRREKAVKDDATLLDFAASVILSEAKNLGFGSNLRYRDPSLRSG